MLSLYLVPSETLLEAGRQIEIEGDEARHIARVAKHRVGERILISNGVGDRARVVIEGIQGEMVQGSIEVVESSQQPKVKLRVVQALTKSDRAHECVELLVAAGVDEIVPWRAERSIGKWDPDTSTHKWEQWIRAGVKQSRRDRTPICAPYQEELFQILGESGDQDGLCLALHEGASERLDSELRVKLAPKIERVRSITLIIGPEGGLSEREVEVLEQSGTPMIRLGTPIFRSAHAGAIALTSLQASLLLWR